MVVQTLINGRYERKEKLGEGGMGVVYRAYDVAARRDVALKTMRDTADPVAVELFSKEWSVLAGIVHPNIVDLLDCGEFTEDGRQKPFFVMPLLPGKTLNQLIHNESQRLTVERTVEILRQVCRGLQAAHERGLVHRDLKPSNILVMDDDTAKIIDFGIVHLTGLHSVTGFKGTVQYMAPEQIDLKPANSASDIFSLGVVGYEALTGRQPFARKDFEKTAEAVRFFVPPPCSSLNPAVNDLVSKVVHKAMAKQAGYRYSSAREFADDLEKALRNVALPRFEARVIRPRIELAKKAFAEGDFQFSLEILNALEAEGNIAPEITDLRRQVEQAIRQRTIKQLLEVARTRFEQGEDLLAIQKLDEALQLDPDNAEVTRLYAEIEGRRSERKIDDWLHLATDHVDGGAFPEARKAIEEALKLDPRGWRANQLLGDLNRREQETTKTRAQKEQLSRAAQDDFESGDISTALSKLERVLELIRRVPDRASPDRDAEYQRLYNLVRSEHDSIRIAYEDAIRCLSEKAFDKAAEICDEQLKKYPNQDLFRALKLKIGEQKRQDLSAYSAEVTRRVDAEADLDRKFNIVKEAVARFPNEVQFKQLLSFVREKRDFVFSIVAKARLHEERGQFSEAIGQWEIVGNIYPQYPDLEFEVEQLRRRREEQLKDEGKARWVEQIERCLEQKEFAQARELSERGLTEHPGDGELEALSRLGQQGIERNLEAQRLLEEGAQLIASGKFKEGCVLLRRALDLDENNVLVRLALIKGLVDQAKDLIKIRWQDAEPFIHDAEQLDPNNTDVRRLRSILQDNRRKEAVNQCLARARDYQANGDILKALSTVEEGLKVYPAEARLWQLRNTLQNAVAEAEKRNERNRDLAALRDLQEQLQLTSETRQIDDILERSQTISLRHADDQDFGSIFLTIREHATNLKQHFPEPSAAEQPRYFETEQEPASVPVAEARRVEARPPVPPAPVPAPKQVVPKPVAPVKTHSHRLSPGQWLAIVSVPVLAAALWLATGVWRMTKQPVETTKPEAPAAAEAPSEYRVAIETDPPGGTIRLNNRTLNGSPYSLPLGKQTVQASLLGYAPATRAIDVGPGTDSITIPLVAEPVRLRLNTDFPSGQVILDGNPIGVLQSGLFAKDDIGAGDHTLQVMDNNRELISVQFKARAGKPASLVSPLKDRDVFVLSKLGSVGRLFAGPTGLRLKDQPAEALTPDTAGTAVGRNEVSLAAPDGSSPHTLALDAPNAPTLLVFSNSAALLNPALTIISNVDNPQIFINGMARNWRASHSKYMNRLDPGKYTVRLAKPGFADAEQYVTLAAGDSKTLTFSLAEKPSVGSLEIPSGTPGAEVFLDQMSIGRLDASGKMNHDKVPPGQHEVMLKKDLYETRMLGKQTITVGQALQISPELAHLVPLGFLSIQIATPGVDVKYKRQGETDWHPAAAGDSIPTKAGTYQVVASADKYQPFEQIVAVEPGKTAVISGSLTRIPSAAKPIAVDLFGTSINWVRSPNGWREFKGSDNYGFLTRRQGTFNVDIRRKGSRFGLGSAIVWVIGYRNQGKDKVEYRIGKNGALIRKATLAGKAGETQEVDAKLNGDLIQLQFEIAPDRIVIRENGGPVLDSYSGPPNITDGDFGFKSGFLLSVTQVK